jgi:Uma2 family endonuclease
VYLSANQWTSVFLAALRAGSLRGQGITMSRNCRSMMLLPGRMPMSTADPPDWTLDDYERAAQEYMHKLPPEHFREAVPSSIQRGISLASLAVLKTHRPRLQVFNELLVQYWHKGKLRQVVPDNMARECDQSVESITSFNLELEPVPPFWVMEYVSSKSVRKDYTNNLRKYERELRVPYYLLFYPERRDLRLYRHDGKRYVLVSPNVDGRLPLAEMELEIGLLEGWVRFWHRGELLELPATLQRTVNELKGRVRELEGAAERDRQRLKKLEETAERDKQRLKELEEAAETERKKRESTEAELVRLRLLLGQAQRSTPESP